MISTTTSKLVLGAVFGVALLAGCNKKPADQPTPQTANQAANPTTVPDPDINKPGGTTGGASSDANPGGTPATPISPDPKSTTQPPSSTTSTNQ